MNNIPTAVQQENYHKVKFEVKGHLALIVSMIEMGMIIWVDSLYQYATAFFDKEEDYLRFQKYLDRRLVTVST